jgi:hypothetical protein
MLQELLNIVFRCGHRNITRPITPRAGGQPYVACLDCGKELFYDLERMKVGAPMGRKWSPNGCAQFDPLSRQSAPIDGNGGLRTILAQTFHPAKRRL